MLTPREDAVKFDPADQDAFRTELWRLVGITNEFWPTELARVASVPEECAYDGLVVTL